jgi:ABC-type multidrug transport system fused ATPase/permease subunit
MVLDAGKLVEFGSPRELLKSRDGLLTQLVEESKDRDTLLSIVKDVA